MFLLVSLPNAKDYLQQSADPRNQEDCTDEMALCEAIMLQTQSLGQNQGDGNDTSKCSQAVLRGQSWGKTEIHLIVVGFTHLKKRYMVDVCTPPERLQWRFGAIKVKFHYLAYTTKTKQLTLKEMSSESWSCLHCYFRNNAAKLALNHC